MAPTHRTVLVIDGSTDSCESYRLKLGQNGGLFTQVLTEPFSELTLKRCQTLPVDGILLDLKAIDNQLTFLRQLGVTLGDSGPPIVTVGSGDVREAVRALKEGAADYLIRDQMTADELCLTLRSAIEDAERKRQLRKSQEQFQAVDERKLRRALDSLFSFVGMLTPDGILIDANRTALEAAGLQPQDVLNRPFEDTYWWAYSPPVQAQLRQAITRAAQGETVRYDVQVRLREDQFITIDFALVPMGDEAGQIEYLVPSGIDVTQRLQAEASLRESQEQLQEQLAELESIYRSAPIGLTVLDRNLRFMRINQLLADINGRPIEAHLGRTVREVLPELADKAESLLQPVLDTGEPRLNLEIEGETPAQPGVKRTWLEHFLPLKRADQVIGISIVCEEITERKHHEIERQQRTAALEASEARFRLLAETIHDVFWMTDFRTCQIQYVSPAYERVWGRPPEAIYQDHKAWMETVHPEDRNIVLHGFVGNGQPDVVELEYRIIRPDGAIRWIRDRGFALRNEAGEIQQMVGIAQDITQQKQAEFALRQSEERYRTLFETMEDGFCVIEILFDQAAYPVDYRFLEVNPAFERHTGLHQAEGKTAREMLPELEEQWFQMYGQVATVGEPVRFESHSKAMDRWFEVYAFPVGSPKQHKVALLFKDINDRKAIETQREQLLRQEQAAREAAERANRVKDEFLAILSHELRSPLNPILGWSKLLQTRQLTEAKTKQALATIERNARLQTQLIDDLLDIARILRGKLKLENTPVNLLEIIEASLDTVRSTAAAKSIHLHLTLPPDIPSAAAPSIQVLGDPIRLQQIFWNLLSNAIKFTPSQGQVTIGLVLEDGQAQITFADTGQGINPSFLPHIFESFRQEDVSITRRHGGLGLGLSIVRYLVEAHGGIIAAYSPGEGLGATFTVQLPLLLDAPAQPSPMIPSRTPNLTGLRVLAVDDEADARQILEAILTHHGAMVRVVATATEALTQLGDFHPHVLISDLGMPQTDGYALIEQVRQRPTEQGGQTPAIALTAYAHEEDKHQALLRGFQRHLAKPFDLEDLIKLIAELAHEPHSSLTEIDE